MFYFLQTVNLLQLVHDGLHVVSVVYSEFNRTFKYSFVARKSYFMDIYVEFFRYHLGYLVKHSDTVDTVDLDDSIKEQFFVHIPFRVENTVTVA